MADKNKKAIVVGASSGIGRAIAKVLAQNGYDVGLVARRVELLRKLQEEISNHSYIKQIDVSRHNEAIDRLRELIEQMQGLDLIILNSGINTNNIGLEWEKEIEVIDVNISGFVAMANVAVKHFLKQHSGHIVGISSIAGLRGSAGCPSYNASKAFVSNYLEGLRYKLSRSNIYVTDIRHGFVDTALIKRHPFRFWVASPEQAARQIVRAIQRRQKIAYITRRWLIVAWMGKLMPDCLYKLRYKKSQATKE